LVKVAGAWRYVYRAIDQHGQVIDVLVSADREGVASGRCFRRTPATLKSYEWRSRRPIRRSATTFGAGAGLY
jgi:transposase-like protein